MQHTLFKLLPFGIVIRVTAWKLYIALSIVATSILIYVLLKYAQCMLVSLKVHRYWIVSSMLHGTKIACYGEAVELMFPKEYGNGTTGFVASVLVLASVWTGSSHYHVFLILLQKGYYSMRSRGFETCILTSTCPCC